MACAKFLLRQEAGSQATATLLSCSPNILGGMSTFNLILQLIIETHDILFLVYFYQLSAVYKPIEQPLLCLPDVIVLASSYIGLYSKHNILIAELVRIQISHTRNQPTAPLFEGVSPEKLFLQWKYLETPFFPSRPH